MPQDRSRPGDPGRSRLAGAFRRLRDHAILLRPHQWTKNALVFLPLVTAHKFTFSTMSTGAVAFLGFCFASSSAYATNDLVDLRHDRLHPRKSRRPLASGAMPPSHALVLAVVLAIAAGCVCMALPPRYAEVLTLYMVATLAYSLFLKRRVFVDVLLLAGLYTLRVQAGLAATEIVETQWFVTFNLFFFLSLAVVKRCSELIASRSSGRTAPAGRGYRVEDLNALLAFGAAAGYAAVLVVALYISSPQVAALYRSPDRLWLLCPVLLYWISRILLICNRGELHDDPVVFALTDDISWAVCACCAVIVWIAI